jgi:hypothetical protein
MLPALSLEIVKDKLFPDMQSLVHRPSKDMKPCVGR